MDEPPRSDAGQDVVIQLPTDWAVLDGRDSVDDHGIDHYDWALVKGESAINMKVSAHGRGIATLISLMRFNVAFDLRIKANEEKSRTLLYCSLCSHGSDDSSV